MDDIRVTIITPSYNQGQFIEATILSVINQSYTNIQYIIADGGSDDNTMDVVDRYKDKIDIIIHEPDNGQGSAINKGVKLAEGTLMGWINSDDILYPDCVRQIVELYKKNPGGAIFYSALINHIDKNGNTLKLHTHKIENRAQILKSNYNIVQPASFYPTDLVKKAGYINEKLHYCMDLDLWLKLLTYGPIFYINTIPLGGFRVWENTKTTTGKIKFLNEIRQTLRIHGASLFTKNIRRTYWYSIKSFVGDILRK